MFGLFGAKKKASATTSAKLPGGIAQSILSVVGARSIPTMPGAAQRAFQLSVDPKAEARDFISVIESDEALSARILKIANSVFFDRGTKSTTIEQSVTVIGLNELRALLNATSLADIFPSKHPFRAAAWANDIGTALIARTISQRLLPSQTDLAFLAGLMHDIGKLLLIQRAPDQYAKVLQMIEQKEISFCEAETQVFPFDHTEAGQLVGEKWNFTPELQDCIRNHHGAALQAGTPVTLAGIVGCADIISHSLGLGHLKGFHRLKNWASANLEQVWLYLGINEAEQKGFLNNCKRVFDTEHDLYIASNDR